MFQLPHIARFTQADVSLDASMRAAPTALAHGRPAWHFTGDFARPLRYSPLCKVEPVFGTRHRNRYSLR